ncbi:MAG: hypothetical protein ABI601_16110 [bacterium]
MQLDLGTSDGARLATDQRVLRFKDASDLGLAALLFQYGRYLLIEASRRGGQPATLQGLWNDSNSPPWDSRWAVNINTEMNYWLAEPANLVELTETLFGMLRDVSITGATTAREHRGAREDGCCISTRISGEGRHRSTPPSWDLAERRRVARRWARRWIIRSSASCSPTSFARARCWVSTRRRICSRPPVARS